MQPMVNLALRAARNAGQDLVRRLDRFDSIQSTDQEKAKFIADCMIGLEKGIIFDLKKSLPEHNFAGRETGEHIVDPKQPVWRIYVIDDIANFRVGIPTYAISIICQINGKTEHAVVTNPMNGDEFTASRGRGAQLNNRRIRSGTMSNLSDAIIGVVQPLKSSDSAIKQRQAIQSLFADGIDVRCIGSSILSMVYVAANRFQGAVICNVDNISLEAGKLITSEAGCLMADINGEPRITSAGNIAVANARLLKSLIKNIGN